MKLSRRAMQAEVPQAYKMYRIGEELNSKKERFINLSLGAPAFNTSLQILQALEGKNIPGQARYSLPRGCPELVAAIRAKLRRENYLLYNDSEIMVSTSARQASANAIFALIEPGDEVLLPTPYWPTTVGQVQLAGGVVKMIPCSPANGFKLQPEALHSAITAKTKLLLFSSPSNPSGCVYSARELEQLAEVLERYPRIGIISNEVFEYFNYGIGHTSLACFPPLRDRVVIVNGIGKGYGMAGWRIGYMAGPQWLIHACERVQQQVTSGINNVAQYAAIIALRENRRFMQQQVQQLSQQRDFLVSSLAALGFQVNKPQGTFYVFPSVEPFVSMRYRQSVITCGDDLALHLFKHSGVATVGGGIFGSPMHIRISYTSDMKTLQEGVDRIEFGLSLLYK
ncbi:MAG: aminotransferase class I/II-fold pyridoxal phosphate-dependent enzyme [Taibaiella sp.]|nr:aminotransferase class I/II-fold pyridoxal phosphate-dependent enzyme [Taibaiella sp.]